MENNQLDHITNKLIRISNSINTIKLNQGIILDGLSLLMERDINYNRNLIRDYIGHPPRHRPRRQPVTPYYSPSFFENIPTTRTRTEPNISTTSTIPTTVELSFMNPRDNNLQGLFNNLFGDLTGTGTGVGTNSETNRNVPLSLQDIMNSTEISVYNENENENENLICSVCQAPIQVNETIRKLKGCNHKFHINCIDNWLVNNTTCPICRQDVRIVNTEL